MAEVKHTVVKGDTLSDLAVYYGTTIASIVKLNNIKDPDIIVIGQELLIISTNPAADPDTNSTTSKAIIDVFGLQSDTDRTLYATWVWDKDNTLNYKIMWYYDTGDSVWFIGSDTTTENKQSTYSAPNNAKRVKFKVKPVSESNNVNGSSTTYWTANWSTESIYDFSNSPPRTPPIPTITIDKYKLTAELSNLDVNATSIQFQIVKNDTSVFNTGTAKITTSSASYSCTVDAGNEYKVRCRSCRGTLYSDWSNYSSNIGTQPSAPSKIEECKASSETSVYLSWTSVKTAVSYDLEYTTKKEYFDGSDQTTTVSGIEFTHYEKTGLTSGQEYFFRVRAVNDKGSSAWSGIKSIVIGSDPVAPTTWSSTTTAIVGDALTLYWVHNSEDGSSQTYAELELYIDGIKEVHTIKNSEDEDEKDKTSMHAIDTNEYDEGTKIQWRVRTAGVTKVYGDWSIQRTVDIYAPPTLELNLSSETLSSFPFYINALAGPQTQTPIGYHVTVTSNEVYETVDQVGNAKIVNAGEQVYSKYFDTSDELLVELSASNIDLENNISYTVTCTVVMDSGLTEEASLTFNVAWADVKYEPNAEIGIDKDEYTASIRPYCTDQKLQLVPGVVLSVYRREFDGRFTELATDLDNSSNTFITDPHPALDYARYRIVAKTISTGSISYYDVPGYPVGGKSIIIQWNESWSGFAADGDSSLAQPTWAGSLLKLPYNVDVSDNYDPDVALVEYIGREHPVSYYGTQRGETATWNVVIDKNDKETLVGVRRLAKWMGDVYVREPSGSGYWANVRVSFGQKHNDLTIPITLNLTRVEGGA